jgi:glycosyltransferase involved in cell wall biosynthesis
MSDFLRHGENGLLVAPTSPTELTQRLRDILGNPTWCAELGERAHLDACRHGWDATARGLLSAYEIAASRSPVRTSICAARAHAM